MSVDWSGYEPFDPCLPGPAGSSRAEALEAFARCMRAKEDRIAALRHLAAAHGVALRDDDASVQALNDWFAAEVSPAPDGPPGQMLPLWYSVAHDIGMSLGDAAIRRRPNLRWELGPSDERDVYWHRPLITGFASEGPHSVGGLDPARVVVSYGHQLLTAKGFHPSQGVVVVKGQRVDLDAGWRDRPAPAPDRFLRMLRTTERRNDGPPFVETEQFRNIMGWWAPVERWLWRRRRGR